MKYGARGFMMSTGRGKREGFLGPRLDVCWDRDEDGMGWDKTKDTKVPLVWTRESEDEYDDGKKERPTYLPT